MLNNLSHEHINILNVTTSFGGPYVRARGMREIHGVQSILPIVTLGRIDRAHSRRENIERIVFRMC